VWRGITHKQILQFADPAPWIAKVAYVGIRIKQKHNMSLLEEPVMDLPIIDLDVFLASRDSPAAQEEAVKAARALITYGALVLHDSRVAESDNIAFLDLLEDYFAQPEEVLRKDERPELSYQIGVTLENTEKPKCAVDEPCLDVIRRLAPEERPLDISGHAPDPKCRFFWRMSEPAPYETKFPGLNAKNIVPAADSIRERWTTIMTKWGESMKSAYVTTEKNLFHDNSRNTR